MNTLLFFALLCQPPQVFGECPDGRCPVRVSRSVVVAARVLTAPAKAPLQAARAVKIAANPQDLVRLHNRLHNGHDGGPHWTWPGNLEEHLRTAHGVQVGHPGTVGVGPLPSAAPAVSSGCPGGVCPTVQYQQRRRIFRRR